MKYYLLPIFLLSSFFTLANDISKDTVNFAANSEEARIYSTCEVIYEHLYGPSDISGKFKAHAMVIMSIAGSAKNLTSNGLAEYSIGYEYQKQYSKGWYDALEGSMDGREKELMTAVYTKGDCESYLK